jgi:hypothetical protein
VIHGSGRRTSPASGVPEARAGPRPRHLAHKLRGGSVMLTRGLWWPGLRRKEEDDDDRRRRGSGARGPTATGGLRGSNYSGSTQEAPVQVIKKLREPGTQRRGRIAAAEQITGGGVVAQFRRCRGLGLQCRLEKLLGIEAGHLRGSWWSEAR